MLTEKDWVTIGRKALGQLPEHERIPFTKWIGDYPAMLNLYNRFPGKALQEWWYAAERYALIKPEDDEDGSGATRK